MYKKTGTLSIYSKNYNYFFNRKPSDDVKLIKQAKKICRIDLEKLGYIHIKFRGYNRKNFMPGYYKILSEEKENDVDKNLDYHIIFSDNYIDIMRGSYIDREDKKGYKNKDWKIKINIKGLNYVNTME